MRFKHLILLFGGLILITGNAFGETTLKDIFKINDKLIPTTPVTNDSLTTDLRFKMAEKPEIIKELLQNIIDNVIRGLKRTNPIIGSYGTQFKKETLTNFINIMTEIIKSKNAKNPEINLLTPDLLNAKIKATIDPGAPDPKIKDDGPDEPITVSLTLQEWLNFLKYYDSQHNNLDKDKYYYLNPVKIYNEEDEVKREAEAQLKLEEAKEAEKKAKTEGEKPIQEEVAKKAETQEEAEIREEAEKQLAEEEEKSKKEKADKEKEEQEVKAKAEEEAKIIKAQSLVRRRLAKKQLEQKKKEAEVKRLAAEAERLKLEQEKKQELEAKEKAEKEAREAQEKRDQEAKEKAETEAKILEEKKKIEEDKAKKDAEELKQKQEEAAKEEARVKTEEEAKKKAAEPQPEKKVEYSEMIKGRAKIKGRKKASGKQTLKQKKELEAEALKIMELTPTECFDKIIELIEKKLQHGGLSEFVYNVIKLNPRTKNQFKEEVNSLKASVLAIINRLDESATDETLKVIIKDLDKTDGDKTDGDKTQFEHIRKAFDEFKYTNEERAANAKLDIISKAIDSRKQEKDAARLQESQRLGKQKDEEEVASRQKEKDAKEKEAKNKQRLEEEEKEKKEEEKKKALETTKENLKKLLDQDIATKEYEYKQKRFKFSDDLASVRKPTQKADFDSLLEKDIAPLKNPRSEFSRIIGALDKVEKEILAQALEGIKPEEIQKIHTLLKNIFEDSYSKNYKNLFTEIEALAPKPAAPAAHAAPVQPGLGQSERKNPQAKVEQKPLVPAPTAPAGAEKSNLKPKLVNLKQNLAKLKTKLTQLSQKLGSLRTALPK